MILLLVVAQFILSNHLATLGSDLKNLESTTEQLANENEILHEQVASASALTTVMVKAKALGFVEPHKTQYLTIRPAELPVAFGR